MPSGFGNEATSLDCIHPLDCDSSKPEPLKRMDVCTLFAFSSLLRRLAISFGFTLVYTVLLRL